MRFKIPDDLSTDDLACFRVMWPNTPEWRSILGGLLYLATRGRSWDEDTGTVVDATAAGRVLFEHNFPLVECDQASEETGGQDNPYDLLASFGYAVCEDCEDCEDNMGCCITNLRWNGSKLEMLRCGEWVEVYGSAGVAAPPVQTAGGTGSGGWISPETGEGSWSSGELPPGETHNPDCDKAYMVTEALWDVAEYTWSKLDVVPVIGALLVKAHFPQYSLDPVYVQEAMLTMAVLRAQPGDQWSEYFSTSDKESLRCHLQRIMSDDYSCGKLEFEGIVLSFAAYSGFTLELDEIAVGHFWQVLFEALGNGTVNELCKSAKALTIVPDCSCPGAPGEVWTTPSQNGWYWSPVIVDQVIDIPGTGWENFWMLQEYELPHDIFGVMYETLWSLDSNILKPMNSANQGGTGALVITDTSTNLTAGRYLWCDVNVGNESMQGYPKVQTQNTATPNTPWSNVPASPEFIAGTSIDMLLQGGFNAAVNRRVQLRFLYNINSPSHSA